MLIGTDQLGNTYSITVNTGGDGFTVAPAPGISPSTPDNSIYIGVLDLISSSLRLINVLAAGETIDTATANDSLMAFNQLIDSWNADRLAIFTTSANDYPLQAGKQAYTLGPGGDFNTDRPSRIDSMSVILLNNPTNPIEVPIPMFSVEQWQSEIPVKSVTGSFPTVCYDDGGFPLRTLNMWPIPTQVNNVRIYSWQGLGIAANLNSVIHFPPGYARALRFNLALELAAEFAAPVPPAVAAIATSSLATVRAANIPPMLLQSDLVSSGANDVAVMFGLAYRGPIA